MVRRRVASLCAVLGAALLATAPVLAQEGGGQGARDVQRGYDEAVADEAVALDAWELGTTNLAEVQLELAEADAAIVFVEGLIVEGERLLAEAIVAREAGEARLADAEVELSLEQDRLAAQAVEAYMGGSRPEEVAFEIAMEAESATEIQSGTEYTAVVLDGQRVTVERVAELREAAEQAAAELADLEAAATEARDAVASYRADLAAKREEIRLLEVEAAAEVERLTAVLEEVQSRRASYEVRLRALENDSDGVAQVLQRVQYEQEPTPVVPIVRSPIEDAAVSSGYGARLHPIFQEMRQHNGIDIGGSMGEEIRAAADGVVVMAEERSGFGVVTVIDHGGQVATLYAHQSRLGVRVGDVVERGQVVGFVGATGYATGPHLHFEIRLLGQAVDPLPFVDFEEPLPGTCEALQQSTDPADLEELNHREDCQDL